MKFYLISPPNENINFNSKNFDKISNILPISYFQFRPKHKSLIKRTNFVSDHFDEISKICKEKDQTYINMTLRSLKIHFDGIHLGAK